MPPKRILKNRCSDIEFGGILESLMAILGALLIPKFKKNLILIYIASYVAK